MLHERSLPNDENLPEVVERLREYSNRTGRRPRRRQSSEQNRWKTIKYMYGMTRPQFVEMIESQNNLCAICSRVFSGKVRPCIDHDHNTGKIRGILCIQCNLIEGLINKVGMSIPILLERMKVYVG